jgi:hypothetical protein
VNDPQFSVIQRMNRFREELDNVTKTFEDNRALPVQIIMRICLHHILVSLG